MASKPIVYKGVQYASRTELVKIYGISSGLVKDQERGMGFDFLDAIDALIVLKEQIEMPRVEVLNYIPSCRMFGQNFRTVDTYLQTLGMNAGAYAYYRFHSDRKEMNSILKEMQKATRSAYIVDGRTYSRSELLSQGYQDHQLKGLEKVLLPRYPQLQKLRFDKNCYDVSQLYFEIVSNKMEMLHAKTEEMGMVQLMM